MGVNWNAGNVRWMPHTDATGQSYPLNHLHPFRFDYHLPADKGLPARTASIQVGFGLHCFTRKCQRGDPVSELYKDDREVRTFDYDRYGLSKELRRIIESLDGRKCSFATHENFLTVDTVGQGGQPVRYGVFFNLKKLSVGNELLLVVQSAYALDPSKSTPHKGTIGFKVLVGHTLRGTKPRKPK